MPPAADDAGPSSGGAAPLNAAANVGATLSKDVHKKEWNGQVSENSFHLFVNKTAEELQLSWGDEVYDYPHSTVAPHANTFVGTYNFHKWRIRSKSRDLIASYTGPSVILTVTDDGYITELNPTGQRPHLPAQPQPGTGGAAAAGGAAGAGASAASGGAAPGAAASSSSAEAGYRQRSSVLGMPILAFDCVSDAAVARLANVVGTMLALSPPDLIERLVAGGASFAVFGTEQVVSDVPAHRFMRYNTGRDLDKSARGLGATPTVPVTSCGEENLTMEGDRWYPCQSILIHEVGHMVHNMGLPAGPEGVKGVLAAYKAARKSRLYPKGCYMMTNEQEYWAVAVESWFESTVRDDVNGGIKTRAALLRHDPALAALLTAAFGDGEWRYWQDCPRPLAMPTRASAAAAAAAAAAPSQRQVAAGAGTPASATAVAAAPSPPSWRSRRPTKLSVDSLIEGAESSAAGSYDGAEDALPQEEDVVVLFRWTSVAATNCLRSLGLAAPAPPGPGSKAAAAAATGGLCGCSRWLPVPPPPAPSLPTSSAAAAGAGAAAAATAEGALLAGLGWLWGPCGGGSGGGGGGLGGGRAGARGWGGCCGGCCNSCCGGGGGVTAGAGVPGWLGALWGGTGLGRRGKASHALD